jgi:hypothetical protein
MSCCSTVLSQYALDPGKYIVRKMWNKVCATDKGAHDPERGEECTERPDDVGPGVEPTVGVALVLVLSVGAARWSHASPCACALLRRAVALGNTVDFQGFRDRGYVLKGVVALL